LLDEFDVESANGGVTEFPFDLPETALPENMDGSHKFDFVHRTQAVAIDHERRRIFRRPTEAELGANRRWRKLKHKQVFNTRKGEKHE
jgi:hypothetical protein